MYLLLTNHEEAEDRYNVHIVIIKLFKASSHGLIRDECRLRVFENILRRIFRPKRDENEWRKLHNEKLHSLYRSPNTVRVVNLEN